MAKLNEIIENGWAKLIAMFFVSFSGIVAPTLGDPNVKLPIVLLQGFLGAGTTVAALFLTKPSLGSNKND